MSYYNAKLERTVNTRVSLTFVLRKNEKHYDNFDDEYRYQSQNIVVKRRFAII